MRGGLGGDARAGSTRRPGGVRLARAPWAACLLLLGAVLCEAALAPHAPGTLRAAQADARPPPPPPPPTWTPESARSPAPLQPVPRPPVPSPRAAAPLRSGAVPPPPPPPTWPPGAGTAVPRQPVPSPGRAAPPPPPAPGAITPNAPAPPTPGAPIPASPVPAGPADPDAPQPVVRQIVFEGNLLYASEMIKTRLRNKEGRPLDLAALDEDMKELYRYFKEIQVAQDPVAGGIVLRFRVSENPLVVRLDVRGNAELDDDEIKQMLRTKEGYPLSPYHLAADREDVEEAYRLRGFRFAHVTEPDVITLPNGGRQVVFTIVEGPEVRVDRILFRGNRALDRKALLEVMLTDEPNFFEQIAGDSVFREDVLTEDLVALKALYRREGYLDAEVALDDLRFSDDKALVEITIAVDEHRPYLVGDVDIQILRVDAGKVASPTAEDLAYFTEDRLRALLGLRPGAPYSGKTVAEGLKAIREAYFARSYLDVQIVGDPDARVPPPILRGRDRENVVDVSLVVKEGPKYRLARIDFVGNEFTRDKILRRDVETYPGGYVDRNELEKGLARIRRTNYFDRTTLRIDDALNAVGEPIEGWKSATYELVEASTGRVSFGLSLSTNGGVGAQIQFQKRNFDIARWPTSIDDITSGRAWTGAGQEFDLLLAPNTEVTQVRARFREPRFFGTHLAFETSVYKILEFRDGYDTDRMGYTLGFGYPIFRSDDDTLGIHARLTWRHEVNDIQDIDIDAIPGAFLFADRAELRSLSAQLSVATLDDFKNPRWETSTSLVGEVFGTFLGGDINMWSLNGTHAQIWTLHEDDEGKKHRLSMRITAGVAEALEETPEVPPYERFYAGGNTFRGFRHRGVGRHVNGQPIGGEWMLLASTEYEFPLVKNLLSVVAFVDQGTVGSSIGASDAWRWRVSVGGGIRLAIPFLLGDRPLALDLGFPILYEDEDERAVVSFTMGRNF